MAEPRASGRGLADWALAAEAAACLVLAAVCLRVLTFARVAALAAGSAGVQPPPRGAAPDRIVWAVDAATGRAPWRAMCFERGLAAQWMLRRRGWPSILCYGARTDGSLGPSAHVWVRLDGRNLVGGEEAAGFALLATFPGPAAGPN